LHTERLLSHDHERIVEDLAAGIESLRPSAISVNAVRAASRPIQDCRKAIDADVVGLCEIAGTIEGRYAHSRYGPKTDYVSLELKAEVPSKGPVGTATRGMHDG